MPISISDSGNLQAIRRELIARAQGAGFSVSRITSPDAIPVAGERLSHWLTQKRHGDMQWMEERVHWRANPATLWPEARSILMLGMNYGPDENPLDLLARRDRAAISVYARHRDYHDLVKSRLKQVARWLVERSGAEVKVFVDTAPVMEKPLAEVAGLGWQGKHTNLVSREFGSWLFLGSIFTTLDLAADTAEEDHCGQCSRCLDICPTQAFPAPYELDARRCISYLTIEYHGHIAREFRKPMGNRIYGCDDCLAVCPWNKFAQTAHEMALRPRGDLREPLLSEFVELDDKNFRSLFAGSPVKRIGRNRFIRNVLIAIGNSGSSELVPRVVARLEDTSPLVRAMAVWALAQLDPLRATKEREVHLTREVDEDVKTEWITFAP
jgi:epoxyqueuosine reductase